MIGDWSLGLALLRYAPVRLVWWWLWAIVGARALLGDVIFDIFTVALGFRGLGRPRLC